MENMELRVGDISANGQVEILAEDKLCYLVKSISRGAVGIRTISKDLLDEYVQFFFAYPNENADNAREVLKGRTQIDNYEYGYSSTLTVMAKMVLDSMNRNFDSKIIQNASISSFAYDVFRYLEGIDNLKSFVDLVVLSEAMNYNNEPVVALKSKYKDEKLVNLFIEKEDKPSQTYYYNEPFNFSKKTVYLNNGWATDNAARPDLTLKKLAIIVNESYGPYIRIVEKDGRYELQELKEEFIKLDNTNYSLQQIYYGAPGTGKSYTINEVTKGVSSDFVFRTTFHPDSDYSTFVGAYKPTMRKVKNHVSLNLSIDDLAAELNVLYNNVDLGKVGGLQKFCFDYHMYMDGEHMTVNVKDLLRRAGISENYSQEIDKYLKFYKLFPKQEEKIAYSFVAQSFLKAYVTAWQNREQAVYLVIEEINRGNCAQIFGDLFQLLDRNEEGVSEYPIKADQDMQDYLKEKFADCVGLPENIKSGDELQLPSNLYIWATMNTSDQSLFPIDSAFKRRWDWEYMPIKYKNTDWIINIKNNSYSWVSFQSKVNAKILDATNSEDKMLGDYFVNPHDGIITEKMLLNKILFYLWNDVCKDGEGDIFKISDTETVIFSELHGEGGSEKLIKMMEALGVAEFIYETDSNESTDPGRRSKPIPKYLIDGGEVQYTTPKAVQKIVQDFATQHTEMSVDDMINFWNEISERKSFLVASWKPSPGDNQPFANTRRFKVEWGDKTVWGINGWTEELFQMFIRNVNNKLNIAIEKVEE